MFAFVNVELFIAMIAINVVGMGIWFSFNRSFLDSIMKHEGIHIVTKKEQLRQALWNLAIAVPWVGGLIADWKTTLLANLVMFEVTTVISVRYAYKQFKRT